MCIRDSIQHVHSGSLYPFSSHRNILEYESFDAACPVESECLYIHSADNGFVEVPYQCGHQQIDRIFSQEGFGQTLPSESVVHFVKDSFLSSTQVVEFYDISDIGFEIIGENAPVGIFTRCV